MSINYDFTPEKYYEVSALNMLLGCFTDSGCIEMNDLKVVCNDAGAVVSEGACILPDKKVIKVPKGGYIINFNFNEGYIFINNGQICAGDIPQDTSEDFFILAHIFDGKTEDLRKRACIHTEEG